MEEIDWKRPNLSARCGAAAFVTAQAIVETGGRCCPAGFESISFAFKALSFEKIDGMVRKKIAPAGGHAQDIATSWARERPDLDPLDYLLSIYLLRIGRIVDRVGSKQWERIFGLSGAEIRVLLALRRAGGDYAMRPTDLFRALLVTSGAITKKVDRMSAAGLVRRINKGGLRVQLTTKGKLVADKTMTEISRSSLLSRTRVSLSGQERKVLARLCEKLLLDFEADAGVLELIE